MKEFLEFMEKGDWQDRNLDSYLFNYEYLIFWAVALIGLTVASIFLRRCRRETVQRVLICIWAFALFYDVSKWIISWTATYVFEQEFSMFAGLPLHTCSSFWYIAPLALFVKNEKLKRAFCNYQCTILLWGGLMGMLLCVAMQTYYSFTSYYGSQIQIYHLMILAISVIMLSTGYYKPRKRDFLLGFAVFVVIAVPVFIFNNIFQTDYMYTYDQSALYIFSFIADALPHRICWTFIAVAGYLGLTAIFTFGVIGVKMLYCKARGIEYREESDACQYGAIATEASGVTSDSSINV